jgi:hypothetical protein
LTNMLQGECLDMFAWKCWHPLVVMFLWMDLIQLSGKGAEFCQMPS